VLRGLGYRVNVRLVPHAPLQDPPSNVAHSIQLIAVAWGDTPYGFFATWFACHGTITNGRYCNQAIDRMNTRARNLQATDPHQAATLWAQIDRNLVDQAASLPMINERGLAFLSGRVTNYQSHPYWGLIADQLSVKKQD
jgi:ABC-type transport system substrate-binding protein